MTTHGDTGTRLYVIWSAMKQRTSNPHTINYALYGRKGVRVCSEWARYEAFKQWATESGYADGLTIDRIDGNGDYCPENCRWVTWTAQENNRCNNHRITYNGITHTLSEWARMIGMSPKTLSRRIVDKGWSVERAFTTPLRRW